MRGAILRGIKILAVTLILCLAVPFLALGQVHEKYEGWCYGLQNASSTDLLEFLDTVVPDEWNARCITWAIHKLGKDHHEPAIPALVKLLDFHLPLTPMEEVFSSYFSSAVSGRGGTRTNRQEGTARSSARN